MADCLINPVQQIWTQSVWRFLEPHVDYWWDCNSNIQGLRQKVQDLARKIRDLNQESEEARLDIDTRARIGKWSSLASEILRYDNIPAWNITSRYSMGKRAKKTAEGIEILINELINEGESNTTADPAPQPAMKYPYHGQIVDIESRERIEKDIIHSLQKSSVYVIGIWGMGGVGKTIMARRIAERVKEESLFDEVVSVTVSQTVDGPKIQNEIAHSLKLEFGESNRVEQLRQRLMDAKRKLIICDDVWESLDFEELGFPIECKSNNFESCKVLLTSRSRDTCNTIKHKEVFNLENLGEREAWNLFKDKAGICDEHSDDYRRVAELVAKECKGLPLALVTLGIALNGATIEKLNHSLSELKRSNPTDLTGVLKYVYTALRLSYDSLEKNGEKDLFLMCCLFPEDYDIPIQQLTWYRMGLELLTNIEEPIISTIEEARNQTHTWAEELKSRSLLIAGKDKHHVKMHDVVRDVGIHIGSRKHHGFLKSLHRTSIQNLNDANCNWMSADNSNGQMEVPVLSRFPNLRLLMLSSNLSSNQFSDISFKGIKHLSVLSFQNISIRSLPSTLGSLQNLLTLRLFHCEVQNISLIGKLRSLKILICCECQNIAELPAEIGRLKGLRLLELNSCYQLQTIPFGIISSLSPLEELKIRLSFSKWGTRGNASLTELERLPNLTCLEIDISDCTLSAQEIRLDQELVRYRISIGSKYYGFEDTDHEKTMTLNLPGAVGDWIQKLARKAEYLDLSEDGSSNINLAEMEKLRDLIFNNCSTVKKLVDINQNVSLGNLKSINISGCSNLKHVFSVWVARTKLLQLEGLEIRLCESMEQVFSNEGTDDNTDGCIEFPKLKYLILENLPKLKSLFPPYSKTDLSQLEILRIQHCDSMEQLFWNEIKDNNTDGCIEFPKLKTLQLWNLPNSTAFCQGLENIIIKFPNLTYIDIAVLPKLKSLFPPYSKTDLSQLEILYIQSCHSMEQLFWNEIKDNNTDGCIEFGELKELSLWNLSNLTAFCQGLENIIIKFPNLTRMKIENLPKLNSLFPLNSETVGRHDQNTCFHLFCNPKVEMGLKYLALSKFEDNIKNIWCHQIPNNFFNNFVILFISYMNGITSLMPTSIAKNLVCLKCLCIINCEEMVEVIKIDDDNDKQVVDINYLFPNLKLLYIEYMPKLRRFWQWNHTLELPLLEEMNIHYCPAMETFTLGSINTPKLRSGNICQKEMDDEKDLNDVICNLNDVIHNIWIEHQHNSKAGGQERERERELELYQRLYRYQEVL